MLQRFLRTHAVTDGQPAIDEPEPTPSSLRAIAGGRTFGGGLYRIHTEESAAVLLKEIDAAFPEAGTHTAPYAYDWLGRQFCAQRDDESATSLMFEPGTGDVLEIPVPFALVHDEELVDYSNEALASDFSIRTSHQAVPFPARGSASDTASPCFSGARTRCRTWKSSTWRSTGT